MTSNFWVFCVMSAVCRSCSHLSAPPHQRPRRELAGTLLTPKNRLLVIVRYESRQPSDGRKASCISPYKLLQNRAICHPRNRGDSQMSWVEARGAAWASRRCHRNPGLVHGCEVFGCPWPWGATPASCTAATAG